MDVHLLTSLVFILFLACFASTLAEKFNQPYTIALVVVGLMVSLFHIRLPIYISHDTIFNLVLPPLLFYGAMHMDLERLKKNWKAILLLAVPGVVITTLLIGAMLTMVLNLPFKVALLFGALISPTDPISVIAILKKLNAPERLRLILEGESLFNDGTGVVVFAIVLEMIRGGQPIAMHEPFTKFLITTGGGTLIGIIIGALGYNALKSMNDRLHEVALTVVITFGTPLLAEHFHMSGIIAVVVAGLIIGNYGKVCFMSDQARSTLENFWEVIDFIINSILFVVIGLELQYLRVSGIEMLWQPIVLVVISVMLARAIVVYPVVQIKNWMCHRDIPLEWSHVLFWGGLKGSISIALVVGLPESFAYRNEFLMLAFGVVVFSLIGQGLTIGPLIKKLGLKEL